MNSKTIQHCLLSAILAIFAISCGGDEDTDLLAPTAGKAEMAIEGLEDEFPEFAEAVIGYEVAQEELAEAVDDGDIDYVDDEYPEALDSEEEEESAEEIPDYEEGEADENLVYAAAWIGLTRDWLEQAIDYDYDLGADLQELTDGLEDSPENEDLLEEANSIFRLMVENPDFHKFVLADCEHLAKNDDDIDEYLKCKNYLNSKLRSESRSIHEIAREVFLHRPGALWKSLLCGLLPVAPALMASVAVITWTMAVNVAATLGVSYASSAAYASIVTMVSRMLYRFGPDKLLRALDRGKDVNKWAGATIKNLQSGLPPHLTKYINLFRIEGGHKHFTLGVFKTKYPHPFNIEFTRKGSNAVLNLQNLTWPDNVLKVFNQRWVETCQRLGLKVTETVKLLENSKRNMELYSSSVTVPFVSGNKLDPKFIEIIQDLARYMHGY